MQHIIRITMIAVLLLLAGLSFAQDTILGRPARALNVRTGPGLDYEIVSVLYTHNRVDVIGRTNFPASNVCPQEGYPLDEWLLVDIQGVPGWVVRCGMNLSGSIADIPVVADDGSALDETILSASESEDLDRLPSSVSIRAPTYGKSEYPIGRPRGVVNIRTEPSLDAEILLVIRSGTFFVVEESEDGGWYRIEWSSNRFRRDAPMNTGWIARHLVVITRWI